MPQPITNILSRAGLDWENMDTIEKSQESENKIKKAFIEMWKDGTINKSDICDNLIDNEGAPDWIKIVVEESRSDIQHEICS